MVAAGTVAVVARRWLKGSREQLGAETAGTIGGRDDKDGGSREKVEGYEELKMRDFRPWLLEQF